MRFVLVAVATVVLAVGCGTSSEEGEGSQAAGDQATTSVLAPVDAVDGDAPPDPVQPVLLEIVPASPAAGDQVDLLFPESPDRGGYFVLERWDGKEAEWVLTHYLVSDASETGPLIFDADNNPCCDEYGVIGPGPDRVDLPEVMEPGVWQICTLNVPEEICGRLTI